MVIAMGGCAVRPLLRRQGEISQPPALAAVVAEDRRRQEVSLQAEEVVEAEVVRPAVPDQVVAGVAAVQAAVQAEVQVEAEAEFSPGLTLTPELPHQIAHNLTKVFIGFAALVFGNSLSA